MKIAIVIGHDKNSQGAYGNIGISEWKFNKELIGEMQRDKMLPKQHEYIIFFRDPNINGYTNKMKDLHKRIDAWGAEVSIEFHFNGSSNPSVNGHEVLYCSKNGKKVAKKLNEQYNKYLSNKDRGIKKVTKNDRGGGFCCRGKSYAIIAEPFFGSNQYEYVYPGKKREKLKKAYMKFLKSL